MRTRRQAVQAIALEDAGYACGRSLDVMVAGQVPNDAHRTQVVGLAEVEYLLDDPGRGPVLGVLRVRLPPNEAILTMLLKGSLPAVETGPPDAEVSAGSADMPGLLGMLQDPQPALDLAIFPGHRRHPPGPIGL